eukprot:CAMPEP_0197641344 /NCGR_PEP_ID=MMETSP1338-20131121/15337_1 /TAXON_ID=43686 ORGANISM="Pelagodinium beii, Strain RCC1491" /NCGR_SAMPLE_ID=MMETSP1338 /ASSEMBLY_ACC=CAM_ASM_000754 /LENGTH=63 /DNA_ID=CAMNT_0043214315 /DNA_START=698 /DNA_END=889 /DNA_ORIENTATION=-
MDAMEPAPPVSGPVVRGLVRVMQQGLQLLKHGRICHFHQAFFTRPPGHLDLMLDVRVSVLGKV